MDSTEESECDTTDVFVWMLQVVTKVLANQNLHKIDEGVIELIVCVVVW